MYRYMWSSLEGIRLPVKACRPPSKLAPDRFLITVQGLLPITSRAGKLFFKRALNLIYTKQLVCQLDFLSCDFRFLNFFFGLSVLPWQHKAGPQEIKPLRQLGGDRFV